MVTYDIITTAKERKNVWPLRHVFLPHLTNAPHNSFEHTKWVEDNWWMVDYHVHMDNKPAAQALALQLDAAFKNSPTHPDIPKLVEELRALRIAQEEIRTAHAAWTHGAYQLVHYCGDMEMIESIKDKLEHYDGEVLEAMCGHNSYLREKAGRTVTALDYCSLSLEKYTFPDRRRIECDLNQVHNGETLHFFAAGQFDAISICCGFRYPEYLSDLLLEFRRILKPAGKISFVESPTHGFPEYTKRTYSAASVCEALKGSGFVDTKVELIPVHGHYFEHIEGTT